MDKKRQREESAALLLELERQLPPKDPLEVEFQVEKRILDMIERNMAAKQAAYAAKTT